MSSRRTTNRTFVPVTPAEWMRVWTQWAEIAWSAPLVMAARTQRMGAPGWPGNQGDVEEWMRMWQEKSTAFGRAWFAMLGSPYARPAGRAARATRPVHRTVVANRRRLTGS